MGLLPIANVVPQGYTPTSELETVKMLAKSTGRSTEDVWEIFGYALEIRDLYHIPPSVTVAVCMAESSLGTSPLSKMTNNCFGLKAVPGTWQGMVYCKSHLEKDKGTGSDYQQLACFRSYANLEAGFLDFGEFLSNERKWWYHDAFLCPDLDPFCWIDAIAGDDDEIGFPTDWRKWKTTCYNVINAYNLRLLDE